MVQVLLPARSSSSSVFYIRRTAAYHPRHRKLAHAYPDALLSVSVASNNEVFESDIYAASQYNAPSANLGQSKRSKWGGRAVLVLIGIRLGIDGVNPLYYDGLKVSLLVLRHFSPPILSSSFRKSSRGHSPLVSQEVAHHPHTTLLATRLVLSSISIPIILAPLFLFGPLPSP